MRNQKKPASKNQNSSIINLILTCLVVVVIYFNTRLQDPFNSPKMWILMMVACWLVGHLVTNLRSILSNSTLRLFSAFLMLFIFSMLISLIFTDDKFTGVFGENLRRNGVLTYFSLAVISLATAVYIKLESLIKIQFVIFAILIIQVFYGQMQISGRDFVDWNNNYNAIITTLGNPNFASALLAILSTCVFGIVISSQNKIYSTLAFLLVVITLWTIFLSDSIQGLVAAAIGIWFLLVVWLYQKSKPIGNLVTAFGLIAGFVSLLGMLQIGPLQNLLYKGSVSVRGYYWQAAVEMLKEKPFWGVGIDSYGQYFKEFRDVGYPLKYGFEITSNNAHNVVLQLFATGGFFVGVTYLAIMILTLIKGLVTIKELNGTEQLVYSSIFASWLVFQAQSVISIDNIGLSIVGWILTGVIIGLSNKNQTDNLSKPKNTLSVNFKQPIASGLLVLSAILVIVPLHRAETNMFKARALYNPSMPELAAPLKEKSDQVINSNFSDPLYKLTAATYLIDAGFTEYGMGILENLNKNNPRDLDVLRFLATANQNLGQRDLAIKYRLEIKKFDQFNVDNLISLGILYRERGDLTMMGEILQEIETFASGHPAFITAKKELSLESD